MSELFPPPELVSKCYALVSSTHARLGFGTLPARIAVKESMVALAMIPRMVHVLGSVSAFTKFRIFAWLLGAVSLAMTVFVNAIWLIGTALVVVAERVLAAKERQQYMFLAAILLALDMLVNDFAGWGTAVPGARSEAFRVLDLKRGQTSTAWLDFYLPRRSELDASLIAGFGPAGRG